VYYGCIALNPDPATMLGQETVVLCGDLPFHQHYKTKRKEEKANDYLKEKVPTNDFKLLHHKSNSDLTMGSPQM